MSTRNGLLATNIGSTQPNLIDDVLGDDLNWVSRDAGCAQVDTEMFFIENGGSNRQAKTVCKTCPLVDACLAYALEHRTFGVWGGTSEKERTRILRRWNMLPSQRRAS